MTGQTDNLSTLERCLECPKYLMVVGCAIDVSVICADEDVLLLASKCPLWNRVHRCRSLDPLPSRDFRSPFATDSR